MRGKRYRKWLAVLLTMLVLAAPVLAEVDGEGEVPDPPEQSEQQPTAAPPSTPAPTPAPTPVPAPTPAPEADAPPGETEDPGSEGEEGPDETAEPDVDVTPEATAVPDATATPEETAAPEETPEVTTAPDATVTPEESAEPAPTDTPEPSEEPGTSAAPDSTIGPSDEGTPEPEESPEPEITPEPDEQDQLGEAVENEAGVKLRERLEWSDFQGVTPSDARGMRIPILYQRDYPEIVCSYNGKGRSVASSGCGATSASMVIAYLYGNTEQTPYTLFYEAVEAGRYFGDGIDHATLSWLLNSYGVECSWIRNSEEAIRAALEEGKPVIAHMGRGLFTDRGHYIVLRGLTEDGKVLLNDPNSSEFTHMAFPISLLLKQARTGTSFLICWVNDPPKGSPAHQDALSRAARQAASAEASEEAEPISGPDDADTSAQPTLGPEPAEASKEAEPISGPDGADTSDRPTPEPEPAGHDNSGRTPVSDADAQAPPEGGEADADGAPFVFSVGQLPLPAAETE